MFSSSAERGSTSLDGLIGAPLSAGLLGVQEALVLRVRGLVHDLGARRDSDGTSVLTRYVYF